MPSEEQDSQIVSSLTQYQLALQLYVQSLMPGDRAAEDVAQETNRIVWEKRADFQIGTNFKAWLFSIARFQVRKCRYRQAKDARLVFCEELEDTITDELSNHLDDLSEHQMALRSCLRKLKPAERDLIRHRYFEGTPLKRYAEMAGRSIGGLKVTLHRIRNNLQTCVEKRLAMIGKEPIA